MADTNGDGVLSLDEFMAMRPPRRPPEEDGSPPRNENGPPPRDRAAPPPADEAAPPPAAPPPPKDSERPTSPRPE